MEYTLRLGWLKEVPLFHPGFACMGGGRDEHRRNEQRTEGMCICAKSSRDDKSTGGMSKEQKVCAKSSRDD